MSERVTLDEFNTVRSRAVLADGAALVEVLAAVERFVRRYLALSEAQLVTVTLWIAHTHALDGTDTTPYLHVTSAEAESGKTRLLEVLEQLVPEPMMAASLTPAVLYRAVEKYHPTLLVDEADNQLRDKDAKSDLLALLNEGYRRGGKAYRIGGASRDRLDSFDIFGAKVIAGLGELPGTLPTRCLRLEMRRRRTDEPVEDFYRVEAAVDAAPIREALAQWGKEAAEQLAAARPARLRVRDRLEEALRLLVAIAAQAGPEWEARARQALRQLVTEAAGAGESDRVLLLRDIRDAFAAADTDRLSTASLLAYLLTVETSPWPERWADLRSDVTQPAKGAPAKLARMLRPHGIRPRTTRLGETERAKGYERADFQEAWSRHLGADQPDPLPEAVTAVTTAKPSDSQASESRDSEPPRHGFAEAANPHEQTAVTAVTASEGGTGEPDGDGLAETVTCLICDRPFDPAEDGAGAVSCPACVSGRGSAAGADLTAETTATH